MLSLMFKENIEAGFKNLSIPWRVRNMNVTCDLNHFRTHVADKFFVIEK